MSEAVQAVVDLKFQASDGFQPLRWNASLLRPEEAAKAVRPLSEKAVEATKAYCEYLWNRYGRFPAHLAPFRTVMGFQVAHLDNEFYDRFYTKSVLTDAQRRRYEGDSRIEK